MAWDADNQKKPGGGERTSYAAIGLMSGALISLFLVVAPFLAVMRCFRRPDWLGYLWIPLTVFCAFWAVWGFLAPKVMLNFLEQLWDQITSAHHR